MERSFTTVSRRQRNNPLRHKYRRGFGAEQVLVDQETKNLVEYVHGGEAGLQCLLRLMKRLDSPPDLIEAGTDYYHRVTARKERLEEGKKDLPGSR
jgi:hypothetical protein